MSATVLKNKDCPIKASFILGYATGSVLVCRLDIKSQRVWENERAGLSNSLFFLL